MVEYPPATLFPLPPLTAAHAAFTVLEAPPDITEYVPFKLFEVPPLTIEYSPVAEILLS